MESARAGDLLSTSGSHTCALPPFFNKLKRGGKTDFDWRFQPMNNMLSKARRCAMAPVCEVKQNKAVHLNGGQEEERGMGRTDGRTDTTGGPRNPCRWDSQIVCIT